MDLLINCLLALLPIIWLIVALSVFKMQAHIASVGAFIIAFIEAIFLWDMPISDAALSALEGAAMALWPIVLVIIAAVFTYNLTVHTKAMDIIKRMITSVSNDKRILVLLVGWCFGGFLEGMAGFGTAIAIPASMLYALGFNPINAILVCLIANGCPTPFGSIGIPTVTLANLVGLDASQLSFAFTIQSAILLFVSPFLMVMLVSKGFKGLKGLIPLISVSSLSFVIPEILIAKFVGAELPVVVAAVCSLIATFLYAQRYSKTHETPSEYRMDVASEEGEEAITVSSALKAWSPFILILVLLLLTSNLVPIINAPLSAIKSTIKFYGELAFTWINTPGVLILISGIIGGLIQGCHMKDFITVMKATIIQMSKTICTMLGVLACAKIMGYSGMISDIATFCVTALGVFYPLVAPVIGCLGTFVTGSGTSSSVLFGNVQLEAAQAIGADPYWLVAANSLGVAAGKMISPQSIAIGCAACALSGKDGEILGKIAKYAFGFLIIMAFIVYFGASIWSIFA